jgi:hypothetical protein
MTDAAAGVHRRARERDGVAGGGAGAAAGAAGLDGKVDERALIMSGPAKCANDENDVMGRVRRPEPLPGASKTV